MSAAVGDVGAIDSAHGGESAYVEWHDGDSFADSYEFIRF